MALANEILQYLGPKPGETIVDCTVGLGGHSSEILKMVSPGGRLVGIDRDSESLALTEGHLKQIGGSYELVWDDFRNLDKIMSRIGVEEESKFVA